MTKDTIYIDVEDDITAIIGKVKSSGSKIVALVPPKRIGVLQSAVNLRLLARAAKQSNKHLVLISGNSALTALAASAAIPSARTLQSKPELASLPDDIDDEADDIINGAELPVGELAKIDGDQEDIPVQAAPAIDSAIRASEAEESPDSSSPRPPKVKRNTIKVPNFDTFRKKLAIGVAGLALLAGFLVWAIWFAPTAHIVISARTIESSANPKVVLATSATTDANAGTIKAVQQEVKREAAIDFEATGEKEVGEKSKGRVSFRSCATSPQTIASGTGISAGGKTYITQATVVVPAGGGTYVTGCIPGASGPVDIAAQEIGSEYDTDQGTQFSVAGQPSSGLLYVRAVADTDIEGGSKRKIKVVSAGDVEKAADQLANQSIQDMKSQLITKFGEDVIAIDATIKIRKDEVTSNPVIDAEAPEGRGKLGGFLVFSMVGVSESEAGRFLDDYFTGKLEDKEKQRVYDNGVDKTSFVDIVAVDNGFTATMTATARFGPKIDDATVKSEASGKRYGEVQSALEGVSGVESVDVKFSPFWVRTVPTDEERITIEFNLDEAE